MISNKVVKPDTALLVVEEEKTSNDSKSVNFMDRPLLEDIKSPINQLKRASGVALEDQVESYRNFT